MDLGAVVPHQFCALLSCPKSGREHWANVLFVATGALMSPTSSMQGESIPGIAHLVHLSSSRRRKGVE